MAGTDTRRVTVYLAVYLCSHLAQATTRYLPSSPSMSPWLPVPSGLYSQPFPRAPGHSHPDTAESAPNPPHSHDEETQQYESNTNHTTGPQKPEEAIRALHRDLKKLARLLPGVYTNMQQYRQEAGQSMPREQRHVLLRSSYRPVTLRFLPRAFCVLAQDFSGDSLFPFRQRVYSFAVDTAQRALRMKVWTFASSRGEKKATRDLSNFRKLRRKDLLSQDSCDMFWRRLDKTTFMGITGNRCLGYVRGEQVRITVSMTLTWQLLQMNEGWYRARDGKTLVEVDVPYNLLRTKSFPLSRKKQSRTGITSQWQKDHANVKNNFPSAHSRGGMSQTARSKPGLHRGSPTSATATPPHHHQQTHSDPGPRRHPQGHSKRTQDHSKPIRDGRVSPKAGATTAHKDAGKTDRRKDWVLPDFDAIAKALHSGHLVFYSVELSACSLPSQMKAERLSFGDFVDSFQSTPRSKHADQASIRFWQSKFVQGDEGMEQITREITIQSNGKVTVRLHRRSTERDDVNWDHSAQCKLFDPVTGLGGVKLTTRPAADVHEIKTFGRFRAALRRGRRQVRMIIDLTHCDGRMRAASNIMGTTVRAYDFINGGKAVEVSELTPSQDHRHNTLLTGHFLNNGEVIFISSPQLPHGRHHLPRHHPLFYRSATFRCALPSSDVTNTSGPWGVRLFYTT